MLMVRLKRKGKPKMKVTAKVKQKLKVIGMEKLRHLEKPKR